MILRFVLLWFVCVSASGQVLVNGSFEAPGLAHTMNVAGAFSFSGWSGVMPSDGGNGGLVVGTDNGLAPFAGNQHFTLNGGNPSDQGYIQQSFSTVAGGSYLLSFAIGRSGAGQDLSLVASVLDGSSVIASGSFAPPASRGYSSVTLSFVATSSTTTLRFSDTSGGNSISDLYIDDVSVTASAIPEPGTYAAIVGAVALGVAVVRRNRRG